MGILEAIKKGFGAASKNLTLVLILFIFNLIWNVANISVIPANLLTAPGATPAAPPAVPPQVAITTFLLSILAMLLSIFMQGGSLGVIRDYIKEGKMKLAQFAPYGLKYYLRLLGLGILIILFILIVALIAGLLIAATMPFKNAVVTVIAAIIAIAIGLAGIYFVLLLVLSPYALVCNESGIITSMKSSINVTKKSFFKIMLLLVVLILIAVGIGVLLGILTGLLTTVLPVRAGQVIIAFVNSLFNGYFGVVMTAAFMVFYLALAGKEKAI